MRDMGQKSKLVFGAMCALLCGLCLANEASGQTLPDGKGKAEFVHNCTACHRAELVVHVKKTPDEWRKSVDDMAARGTDGTKEDLDNVVLYLDTYFSTDKPAPPATTQPTTPSSTSGVPEALNASEIERVKRVIAENGCLTCRRIEQQGSHSGPALNQWLALYAAEQGFTYLDYYTSMAGPDGGMKPGISKDGVHPNAAGYAIMEPLAEKAIEKALRK